MLVVELVCGVFVENVWEEYLRRKFGRTQEKIHFWNVSVRKKWQEEFSNLSVRDTYIII